MDKLGEIISRVERRRKWTPEQKVKILTEVLNGATVSAVADRKGISRSQLYAWKKLAQRGDISGISLKNEQPKSRFAPVRIEAAPSLPAPAVAEPTAQLQRRAGTIKNVLINERIVRTDAGIEPVRLARLVAALDGTRS